MEIEINFDNLQIETLNMNLEKNTEKPATGKQLWKLQNQVLRNLRIIDTLKKACTTYHIEDKQYRMGGYHGRYDQTLIPNLVRES